MGYIVPHFVNVLLTFQLCFVLRMENIYPAVMKEVKMATSYGWKYSHYFAVAVTVIVSLPMLKFCILVILLSFLQFT